MIYNVKIYYKFILNTWNTYKTPPKNIRIKFYFKNSKIRKYIRSETKNPSTKHRLQPEFYSNHLHYFLRKLVLRIFERIWNFPFDLNLQSFAWSRKPNYTFYLHIHTESLYQNHWHLQSLFTRVERIFFFCLWPCSNSYLALSFSSLTPPKCPYIQKLNPLGKLFYSC